ncbi:hypothetical protein IE53DRAFT_186438 [Violaceomyces palustris]|uniref:Uncharacterized protein n=1 Tax=Violaceomyces palustris TaxID=1673888 RepID=A0ACD0P5C3_9BASI|nr:hypothetical protein IE53DRAFT_186438 [Violaceomyces palustris]
MSIPPQLPQLADPAEIPLDSLRAPRMHHMERSDSSQSSIGGPPPTHHVHPHAMNDPNFYEGLDPGNQGGYEHHHRAHDSRESSSGSGSSGHNKGWGQYDTLVNREKTDTQNILDDEKFESPRAPFAQEARMAGGHSRATSIASSADDSDDFDWDTSDDDEDDEDADPHNRKIRARRGRRLYLSCLRLARPVRILLFAIVGTAICLTPFIVTLAAFKDNAARPEIEVWSIWIAIIWAAGCGTFLIIDWIPPLAIKLAIAFYGKAPEIFKTYVEAFMATSFWIKLALCVTWAWISLGGVLAIQYSGPRVRPAYFRWVILVLKALFASMIILLVEKVALQMVAINFHKTSVKDRLEANQKALRALDKLHESKYLQDRSKQGKRGTGAFSAFHNIRSRPTTPGADRGLGHGSKASRDGLGGYFPPAETAPSVGEDGEKKHHQHPSLHLHKHSHDGIPTDRDRQRAAKKANLAAQLSDALAMATMKGSKLYKGNQLGSQRSARKLAKMLFTNLSDNKQTLVAEDFVPYFKSDEEAKEAFGFFDADKNGDISKEEMREAVQRIYRERRALSTSLKDMSSAISKLDMVFLFLGLIVVVFIWLLIFNGDSTVANIVPLSTFVVGFSFIFGNTAKNIFESMIFIFATHPYDVGDLVCIDDDWMFVKEFGLLSTTFRTTTNQEIVSPNALLASSKYIYNSRRSGSQWEVVYITVGFDTSIKKIDQLRARLRAYVKENDRDWGGGLDVNYVEITQQNAVQLVIAFEHKGNWQAWGLRWERRTKMMRMIKNVCEDLNMTYELPPQPVTFSPRSGAPPFRSLQKRTDNRI